MCCCSKQKEDVKGPVHGTTVETTKQLATDPVCGMAVDPANASSIEYEGKLFYFCCPGCTTKFRLEPAKYFNPKRGIHSCNC